MSTPQGLQTKSSSFLGQRHWMLTLFSVLIALNAIPQGLYASAYALDTTFSSAIKLLLMTVSCMPVMGFYFTSAWGLWKRKNWSRYTLILIIVINFIFQVFSESTAEMLQSMPAAGIFALILGFFIRGYIVHWFMTNDKYFENKQEYSTSSTEFEVENEDLSTDNSRMLRVFVVGSLAGVGTILIGVAFFLVTYLSKQSASQSTTPITMVAATLAPRPTSTPIPPKPAAIALTFEMGNDPQFQYPERIVADNAGYMYISYDTLNKIQIHNQGGVRMGEWTSVTDCKAPYKMDDIEIDNTHGYLYVVCGMTLYKYDLSGGYLLEKFNGMENSPADRYSSIAVYPDGSLLMVSDGASIDRHEELIHLDMDGKELGRISNPVSNITDEVILVGIFKPVIDSAGNVYLLYPRDGIIYKFDPKGNFIKKFTNENFKTGITNGNLNTPAYRIAIDSHDRIFTVDSLNLIVFDTEGNILQQMSVDFADGVQDMFIANGTDLYLIGGDYQAMTSGNYKVFKLKINQP